MSPKYTLNYFPIAGLAEPARLMFKIAGVEFTDNMYAPEEWGKIKSDSKYCLTSPYYFQFFSIF